MIHPAPKPVRVPKAAKPLQRRAWIRRGTKAIRPNVKRKASEFARCFGSRARVAWVKSRPCCVSLDFGSIENVHVVSRGAGGTFLDIVPLNRALHEKTHGVNGGWSVVLEPHGLTMDDLTRFAADTEKSWLRHCARVGLNPESGETL